MTEIPVYTTHLPFLTSKQMIEVDRAMIEDYGILLIQMMENAGRNLANLAIKRFLKQLPSGKNIIILAGPGGNGGGALVCARMLHNYGSDVHILTSREKSYFKEIPAHQLEIISKMGISITNYSSITSPPKIDLIIDGLIGYSLRGAPRDGAANLINWANLQAAPILSLDTPSGMDSTNGTVHSPTIKASATMSLALPKIGQNLPEFSMCIGELYLADISVPPGLFNNSPLNLDIPNLFAQADVIRLKPNR